MRRKVISLLFLCTTALVWATTPSAQQGACANDVREFCGPDVVPGEGAIAKCLYEHRDEVSDGCRIQAEKRMARILQVHTDCVEDAGQFCSDVDPGQYRIARCLSEHRDSLSGSCQAHVDAGRRTVAGLEACQEDADRLCSSVPPGERRLLSCLWRQREDLNVICRRLLEQRMPAE